MAGAVLGQRNAVPTGYEGRMSPTNSSESVNEVNLVFLQNNDIAAIKVVI